MKKLLLLPLILFIASVDCFGNQHDLLHSRQQHLNKAIKTSNLKSIVDLIKNIKYENDSMDIFNNKKLLEQAFQRCKNSKHHKQFFTFSKCLLYSLIPILFILPYAAFYKFYKNQLNTKVDEQTLSIFDLLSLLSTVISSCSFLGLLIYHIYTVEKHQKVKLIYKIIKKYTQTDLRGIPHV